jgi:hypothetical protein
MAYYVPDVPEPQGHLITTPAKVSQREDLAPGIREALLRYPSSPSIGDQLDLLPASWYEPNERALRAAIGRADRLSRGGWRFYGRIGPLQVPTFIRNSVGWNVSEAAFDQWSRRHPNAQPLDTPA